MTSPDGQPVYTATEITDILHTFRRNLDTGALTCLETFADRSDGVDGLESACSVAVDPDDILVSVTSFDDGAVEVLALSVRHLVPSA